MMQVRRVQFTSTNPIVAIALLTVVLALLAFFLSAALAFAAGAVVLGGVGYGVRRLFGGRAIAREASLDGALPLDPRREVFQVQPPTPSLPDTRDPD